MTGAVSIGNRLAITISAPQGSCLLILDANGTTSLLQRERVRATCVCACGAEQVALAWSDGRIELYSLETSVVQKQLTSTGEEARVIACHDGTLLSITSRQEIHAWAMDSQAEPVRLSDTAIFPRGIQELSTRLVARPDGAFTLMTNRQIASFRITSNAREKSRLHRLFEIASGQLIAVQEREDGLWLLDQKTGRQTQLTDATQAHQKPECGCSNSTLLIANPVGASVLVDLASHELLPCPQAPPAMASIATDIAGNFWLADRFGQIFRMTPDGSCTNAATVPLRSPVGPRLVCAGNMLIWAGCCLAHTDAGTESVAAFVFYRRDEAALTQIGHRIFAKRDGMFYTWDYDPAADRLLIAAGLSAMARRTVRTGSPTDFIHHRDVERPLENVPSPALRIRAGAGGHHHVWLCQDGSLLWIDSASLHVQAALTPSIPLTDIVQSSQSSNHVLVIADDAQPIHFQLETP